MFLVAFHDCVGPNGCDGCLNLNNSDNAGLAGIVQRYSDVRKGDGGQNFMASSYLVKFNFFRYGKLLFQAIFKFLFLTFKILLFAYILGHIKCRLLANCRNRRIGIRKQ